MKESFPLFSRSIVKPLPPDRKEIVLLDVFCLAGFLIVETEAMNGSIRRRVDCI